MTPDPDSDCHSHRAGPPAGKTGLAPAALPRPWVRTPMVESAELSKAAGCRLDRSNLGIGNFIRHSIDQHPPGTPIHFYALSGGNAGLACVHAARALGKPATVVVPLTTRPVMVQKLIAAGATSVLQQGASLKEAAVILSDLLQRKAEQDAETVRALGDDAPARTVNIFVPPYDHQFVWSGNGTLAWEIAEQLAELDGVDVPTAAAALRDTPSSPSPYLTGPPCSARIADPVDMNRPPPTAVAAAMATAPPAAILCSVGGGGLLNGLVEGLDGLEEHVLKHKSLDGKVPLSSSSPSPSSSLAPPPPPTWSATPIVATETAGADSLAASMLAWENAEAAVMKEQPRGLTFAAAASVLCPHPITLDRITSAATSLGVSRVSERTFAIATGLYNNGGHGPMLPGQNDGVPVQVESSDAKLLFESDAASRSGSHRFHNSAIASPTLCSSFSSTMHSSVPSSASSVSEYHEKPSSPVDAAGAAAFPNHPAAAGAPLLLPPTDTLSPSTGAKMTTTMTMAMTMTAPPPVSRSRRPAKSIRPLVLTDEEAALGCVALSDSDRLMVELACGINVAALFGGRLQKALGRPVGRDEKVVVVVCGGSDVSAERLAEWRSEYGGVAALLEPVA